MGRHAEKDILEVSLEEIASVRKRIEESDFPARDKAILLTLIEEIVTIKQFAKEKRAYLDRIKRMLEKKSEKRPREDQDASDSEDSSKEPKPPPPPRKGHGRIAADAYNTSQTIEYPHQTLTVGQACPDCNHGTLQPLEPRKIIRLTGNAPITAELHKPARLRCGGCGQIFTAELPPEVEENKADASANALVAVFRYAMGIPHFRLANLQRAMGVPLPASTQYEMVEMLWTQVVPVFKELLHTAGNWPLVFVDDTPLKIIELLKDKEARKEAGERVGVFTTAIVARQENKEIRLFFTGRNHAGENLGALLDHRDTDLPPAMQMSDALSRNFPKNHLTIVTLCLIHGRRNFIDCESAFPEEAEYVINRIALVYKHEKHIKAEGMNDQQRLEYHQEHSRKPMDEIKAYAHEKLDNKVVEDNSSLGLAFNYMINQWPGLTMFLEIPGAPIDNNPAERLVKACMPHRRASLFYKTQNGAIVGDCMMSLCQTCIANDENPFEYLTILQNNARHVAKNPQLWLPWNYRNTLRSIGPPPCLPGAEKGIDSATI